jgi:para-aminobenzoate synthetase / 4-amino-4-deoxychorismate lyase
MTLSRLHESVPARVVLRDAASGRWLQFERPRAVVQAQRLEDVVPGLGQVEAEVARGGVHAAGFISYEAAPAFDEKLVVRPDGEFPLLWFGLYENVEEIELPSPAGLARHAVTRPAGDDPSGIDWQPSVGQAEFHRELARIKALIRSGDTYQVNYTYRLRARYAGAVWGLFVRLVAAQEAPYGAFVDTGDWVICSASPELFFCLDGTHIQCRPMKGTAARGRTETEDLARAQALKASEKERAENVMIVDMVRHDLGRIAQFGSVKAARLFEVERYPTIWQMTSTVDARTQAGLREIFRALFPPSSVTGAPKVRTMQIIAGLETLPRRLYTGAIGFFAPGRRAQFSVAIRTLLANRRTGWAEYGVGSGITWDSEPGAEWQECRSKAQILSASLPTFSLLETMRWTPEEGYFLLDRHLERLQESARYFGFSIRLSDLLHQLEQLALGLERARHKVRLLVTKEGRVSLEAEALHDAEGKPQRVALARTPVDSSDSFLFHKTTNRQVYEAARSAWPEFCDVLLFNKRGEVTESTIANIAVELEGKLYTPPVSCGLLAGTLRAHLIREGELIERPITVKEALDSRRVFLMNSLRGKYRIEMVHGQGPGSPRSGA